MGSQETMSWFSPGDYCLLCSSHCENVHKEIDRLNIPGGKDCESLQKRLEQFFVLTRILDVDKTWCGELLRESSPSEEENGDGSWFRLCGKCEAGRVLELWKIWQQIQELTRKMKEIGRDIKETMRKEVEEELRSQKPRRFREGHRDYEIRRKLFPELFIDLKYEIQEEEIGNTWTSSWNDEDNFADSNVEDRILSEAAPDSSDDPNFVPKPKITKPRKLGSIKRRRGRPPKNQTVSSHSQQAVSDADSGRIQDNLVETSPATPAGSDPDFNPVDNKVPRKRQRGLRPRGRPPKPHNPDSAPPRKRKIGRGRPSLPAQHKKPSFHPPDSYVIHKERWKVKQNKYHTCLECGVRYLSVDQYEAHLQCHTDLRENRGEGILICELCSFPTRDSDELATHIQNRRLKGHGGGAVAKPPKVHECSHSDCKFQTLNWKVFAQHLNKEHGEDASDRLKCPLCDYHAMTYQGSIRHRNQSHPELQASSSNGGESLLQCSQCPLKFVTEPELQKHLDNTHNRSCRFVCELCGAGFPVEIRLKQHMVMHADKEKSGCVCHLCGLTYKSEKHVRVHIRNTHKVGRKGEEETDETEHQCRYCDMKSPFKWYIRKHQVEAHRDQMLKYPCEICGNRYSSAQAKNTHHKMTHGAKPESCELCGKEFASSLHLRNHVKHYCQVKRLQDALSKEGSIEGGQANEQVVSTSEMGQVMETL